MKRFAFFILTICISVFAFAQTETLNWYMDGNTYATTTCESGDDVLLPAAPTKRGYTFKGWVTYQPIEYLESTGTQYIDTGVVPNDDLLFVVKLMARTADFSIFGARTSEEQGLLSGFNNSIGIFLDYGSGSKYNRIEGPSWNQNQIYSLSFGNRYIKNLTNNVLLVSAPSVKFTSFNVNIYLFQINLNGTPSQNSRVGRIYYLQIYDNDVLVRDFIPVLDANGTPCMYDKVEKKFYYNQGTGQFIAGPVLTE